MLQLKIIYIYLSFQFRTLRNFIFLTALIPLFHLRNNKGSREYIFLKDFVLFCWLSRINLSYTDYEILHRFLFPFSMPSKFGKSGVCKILNVRWKKIILSLSKYIDKMPQNVFVCCVIVVCFLLFYNCLPQTL